MMKSPSPGRSQARRLMCLLDLSTSILERMKRARAQSHTGDLQEDDLQVISVNRKCDIQPVHVMIENAGSIKQLPFFCKRAPLYYISSTVGRSCGSFNSV